jgi:hypothetical protein
MMVFVRVLPSALFIGRVLQTAALVVGFRRALGVRLVALLADVEEVAERLLQSAGNLGGAFSLLLKLLFA